MRIAFVLIAGAALGLAACSEQTKTEAKQAGDTASEAIDQAATAAHSAFDDAEANTKVAGDKLARKTEAAANAAKETE